MFREQHIESLVASQEERKKELQQKQEELEERVLKLDGKTEGLTLFAKKLLSFMSADYAKKSGAEAGEDKKIIESSILELASISTKIKNISENIDVLSRVGSVDPETSDLEIFKDTPIAPEIVTGQENKEVSRGGIHISIGTNEGGPKSKYKNNEDCAAMVGTAGGERIGFFALDGMGGHGRGDVASQEAARILTEIYSSDGAQESSLRDKIIQLGEEMKKVDTSSLGVDKGSGLTLAAVDCDINKREIELLRVGDADFLTLRMSQSGDYVLAKDVQDRLPPPQSLVSVLQEYNKKDPGLAKKYMDSLRTQFNMSGASDNELYNKAKNVVTSAVTFEGVKDVQQSTVINIDDLGEGALVFGFSDGIGDNIMPEEMLKIANNNKGKGVAAIREAIMQAVIDRTTSGETFQNEFVSDAKSTKDNVTLNVMELSDEFFSIKKEEERKSVASEYVHKRLHSLEDVARLKALIPEGMFSEEEMEVAEKVVSQAGVYEISSARSGGADMYNLQRLEGYSGNLPDKHPLKESILTLLKAEKKKVKERLKADEEKKIQTIREKISHGGT